MHTEKTKLFENTYASLSNCHIEIKFSEELTDFEIDRARKLLNFCRVMIGQFSNDERFCDLFEERGGETKSVSEIISRMRNKSRDGKTGEIAFKLDGEFGRFHEQDNF